jgi:hypothetical protein
MADQDKDDIVLENDPLAETPAEETPVAAAPDEDVVQVNEEDEPAAEEKPAKRFVRTTNDDEVTEEDLAKYSEEVQKRIKRLTWKTRNEQRGREQAERDRDEAVRIAQVLLEEKRAAESRASTAQEASHKSTTERLDVAIAAATQRLKDAFEAFDGAEVASANAELARLTVQRERLADEKPAEKTIESPRQEERSRVDLQQPPQQARPDPLAEAWAKRNSWFQFDGYGRPHNPETAFALKVHETLLGAGVHPTLNAAEYYRKLDATMRANFPEHYGETPKAEQKPAAKTPVSGVTRSPTGAVTKVRLSESQIRLAKSLGITPEDYAKEVAALNRS